MKKTIKKSYITVPIVLAVAVILVLSMTVALFTFTESGKRRFTLSNFASSVEVSFDNFSTIVDLANDSTAGSTVGGANYYNVSLQSNAANYLGNFRVRVKYNGKGVGLVRVHVAEEWYETKTGYTEVKPFSIDIPYLIGANNANLYSGTGNQAKWFDNRSSDYCFYYATPLTKSSETTIPLITGLDTSKIDLDGISSGTNLRIMVEADVVQVNRYPQYWGINVLPWSGASSATEIEALTTAALPNS